MRKLVLWGHSLDDYRRMFGLNEKDLSLNFIEVASGPTAFNVEQHLLGHRVTSVDELFQLPLSELEQHMQSTFSDHEQAISAHSDVFKWGHYGSLKALTTSRKKGMQEFLKDFPAGKSDGRYIAASPTHLPFPNFTFDIALLSHHLFAESDPNSIQNDLAVIKECARVAKEIRIFPLVDNQAKLSPTVGPVMLALQQEALGVEIKEVPYNLQDKSNAMMRVWALTCPL